MTTLGVMGLFAAAVFVVHGNGELAGDLVQGFQIAVPLLAGVLASGLVVGDPALELVLSVSWSPFRALAGRLAALLVMVAAAALIFELLAWVLGVLPARLAGPLGWIPPWLPAALALGALGSLVSLAARDRTVGALVAGTVWVAEFLAGDAMLGTPWLEPFYLFMAVRAPTGAPVPANMLALAGLAAVFTAACAPLLRRPERYL